MINLPSGDLRSCAPDERKMKLVSTNNKEALSILYD